MKKCLVLIFLALWCFSPHSKEVKLFKNFGLDNPMSYKFVRTIAQDQDGFMWFGSHEGLHRFDGYQFLSFHHDATHANSLSSDVISKILIDKQQRLWVGTAGAGLNLFRERNQDFLHITAESEQVQLSNNVVNVIFEDSLGQLWVGTEQGLNILTYRDSKWQIKQIFQELGNPNSLTHNTVHAVIETASKHIWVGTNGGGVSVFDLQGNFVQSIKLGDTNTSTYENKFINSLLYDEKGDVWIGTFDNGLIKYHIADGHFKHFTADANDETSIVSNTIKAMYLDSKQKLWIATDKGLLIYNDDTGNFSRFNHTPNNPYSLSNDYILSFFEDSNQMMWIGTFTGVNRWDPNMTTFSQFSSQTNPVLANNNITSFTQQNSDSVIFSTYSGGIYRLSLADNSISRLDFNDYFSSFTVMSLLSDGNYLWVGTRGSGLHRIDMNTKEIKQFEHNAEDPNSISANSVTDIIKDRNGNIWVSTFHQGLNRLLDGDRFKRYVVEPNEVAKGPSINHILQLLEGKDGDIWIATYGGGLNRFDIASEAFTHIRHEKNNAKSLTSDTAWILFQDSANNLWVGTQAAGFNSLSHENILGYKYEFTHLDTKDGMKSRTIYGVAEDSHANIWFSSNKGISRYSAEQGSFRHFDLTHGLVDLEFSHGAIFKDTNNTLYFGAGKGLTSVNPDKLYSNLRPPQVKLTNIFKLNEPMSFDKALSSLQELQLDYSDQIVSFEYVGLNYANPESTRYKYRLLGFDQEWIDAGKSRRATYTNLPAGSYQLEVIAGNNDNVWSDPGLSLNIVVKPAPWNTWWAYLLYAVSIALVLLAYSRFLNRKLLFEQEQKQYLKQQVQEKTKEFQQKNIELEQANKQLENAATTDKLTGVKSRRYLDIYIEQASQLMSQIHENILPVQRSILPRLYLIMVRLGDTSQVSNSQLVDLTDLLLYSRNKDDLVIRWSEDTFAIIGYEKEDNARELAARLCNRFSQVVGEATKVDMAYSFYPFNFEQPMELSWDQVSVLTEYGLKLVKEDEKLSWLGMYAPKNQPFNYLEVLRQAGTDDLAKLVKLKQG